MKTLTDTEYIYFITVRNAKYKPNHTYVVIKRVNVSDIVSIKIGAAIEISTYHQTNKHVTSPIFFNVIDAMKYATITQQLFTFSFAMQDKPICEIVIENME